MSQNMLAYDSHSLGVDAGLLLRFPQRGLGRGLTVHDGPTWHGPRTTLMTPQGAVLQRNLGRMANGIAPEQEQPGRAIEAPVLVAAPAFDPAVARFARERTGGVVVCRFVMWMC